MTTWQDLPAELKSSSWLAFEITDSEEFVRAHYRTRYGAEPQYIVTGVRTLFAGPVPEEVARVRRS
ncbi:MAG: hypothetical protein WC565_07600 [Parcubacteria group bacterium]